MVKPGYTDSRRGGGCQRDQEVQPTPDVAQKKKDKKKVPLPKVGQ